MRTSGAMRVVFVAGLAGMLLGGGAGAAQAQVYHSVSGAYYANPHYYTHYASIDDFYNRAETRIRKSSGAKSGLYTIAAQARLFVYSNNALCTSSSYSANTSLVVTWYNATNGSYCGAFAHYSKGITKANAGGSTWIQYATSNTPHPVL